MGVTCTCYHTRVVHAVGVICTCYHTRVVHAMGVTCTCYHTRVVHAVGVACTCYHRRVVHAVGVICTCCHRRAVHTVGVTCTCYHRRAVHAVGVTCTCYHRRVVHDGRQVVGHGGVYPVELVEVEQLLLEDVARVDDHVSVSVRAADLVVKAKRVADLVHHDAQLIMGREWRVMVIVVLLGYVSLLHIILHIYIYIH